MQNKIADLFQNALEVYAYICQPVCRKYHIQQSALDILLFLANNPEKNTAVDVHKCRGIKQSMVSFHVDRLVSDGYLERIPVPGDRRKVQMICTKKAQPVIEEGRKCQEKFGDRLFVGFTQDDRTAYERILSMLEQNVIQCKEMMEKGDYEKR